MERIERLKEEEQIILHNKNICDEDDIIWPLTANDLQLLQWLPAETSIFFYNYKGSGSIQIRIRKFNFFGKYSNFKFEYP